MLLARCSDLVDLFSAFAWMLWVIPFAAAAWVFKRAGLVAAIAVFLILGAGYVGVAIVASDCGYEAPQPPPR